MPKISDLQESRAAASRNMRALLETAETETRDLTDAEDGQFKSFKAEVATLDRKIERARDLAEAERAAPAILHQGRGDGRFEEKARSFSVVKAIRAAIGDGVDAGFEREISAETERRTGRSAKGILVPDEYFTVEKRAFGDGIMTVGSEGASLYPTMHRGDLFVDMLRAKLVVGRLGATVLDGLVGSQDIPRQASAATAQWVAEDGSITDSQETFDDVQLTPKTVAAISSYTRRLLLNAVPSIENIVRNDLAQVIANAIDLAALVGTGMSNQPKGVTAATNVSELTLATPTWSQVLDFISTVQMADGDVNSQAWAMNPNAVKKLRTTLKSDSDTSSNFLMTEPGALAGFPVATTSALPGNIVDSPDVPATVIFGAWSELLVGYWSGVDLLVNPYETTAFQKGRVLIRAMRDCDITVRHGESFAFADDLPVTAGE